MRLTWQGKPCSSAESSRASRSLAFFPAIRTYSKVTRRPVVANHRRAAAISSGSGTCPALGTSSRRSSCLGACSEIASPYSLFSAASRSIRCGYPTVEIVIRRAPIPSPRGSFQVESACASALRFMVGSPIPMTTMFVTASPSGSASCTCSTCSTISPGVRLRMSPSSPDAQKTQATGQPTCVETQTVRRSSSGISTVSIDLPSESLSTHARVPPGSARSAAMVVRRTTNRLASASRNRFDRSLIASKDLARRWNTQRIRLRPAKAFSPSSSASGSKASRARSVRAGSGRTSRRLALEACSACLPPLLRRRRRQFLRLHLLGSLDELPRDRVPRRRPVRQLVEELEEDLLHDRAQRAHARLLRARPLRDDAERLRRELELAALEQEHALELAHDRVARLDQDADEVVLGERVEDADHRQAADELRDHPELDQVLGLDLLQHPFELVGASGTARIARAAAPDLGAVADAVAADAAADDVLELDERAAHDEEDVVGVDLQVVLLGVLAAALRRDVRYRALEDLEEPLLHALARDVACDRDVLRGARDLVDLVDVGDAAL